MSAVILARQCLTMPKAHDCVTFIPTTENAPLEE